MPAAGARERIPNALYTGGTMTGFSQQLIKARSAAGFDTAYKFYHRNGGRKHFSFTFVQFQLDRPGWGASYRLREHTMNKISTLILIALFSSPCLAADLPPLSAAAARNTAAAVPPPSALRGPGPGWTAPAWCSTAAAWTISTPA